MSTGSAILSPRVSSEEELDRIALSIILGEKNDANSILSPHNMCPDCHIGMEIVDTEYRCPQCGMIRDYLGEPYEKSAHGCVKVKIGNKYKKYRSLDGDTTKSQLKYLMDDLTLRQASNPKLMVPMDALQHAAARYNSLQQHIKTEDVAPDGTIITKKFMHRMDKKNSILAQLIFLECIKCGQPRKKEEIARFMGLPQDGFSYGDRKLKELTAKGLINLNLPHDNICQVGGDVGPTKSSDELALQGFTKKYLEALGIMEDKYFNFVVDLVLAATFLHIGTGSRMNSKIVGAIWTLNLHCGLGISPSRVERCCDGTKKNTYVKFYNAVIGAMNDLKCVFTKHKVRRTAV